jgi:hypothetical protein
MLLSKVRGQPALCAAHLSTTIVQVMLNSADDVQSLLSGKIALRSEVFPGHSCRLCAHSSITAVTRALTLMRSALLRAPTLIVLSPSLMLLQSLTRSANCFRLSS